MKDVESEKSLLVAIMRMLSKQFGSRIELVLHDWAKGYDHSIIAIEGSLTNRKVGDCGNNLGLEVIKGSTDSETRTNYVTKTKDGKTLASSTLYLKDDTGKPVGALCLNYDISNLEAEKVYYESIVHPKTSPQQEYFPNNISELLNVLLDESISKNGKTVNQMNKEDKIRIIEDLDKKGVFLITKSSTKVCEVLSISKFTLYNYLEEIRKRENNI